MNPYKLAHAIKTSPRPLLEYMATFESKPEALFHLDCLRRHVVPLLGQARVDRNCKDPYRMIVYARGYMLVRAEFRVKVVNE